MYAGLYVSLLELFTMAYFDFSVFCGDGDLRETDKWEGGRCHFSLKF
jgi:hypothetical protein